VADGHFYGKMIMVGSTMDVEAYPWSEDWYAKQAQAALGSSFPDSFRLWYMDNADHGPILAGPGVGPPVPGSANAADHIVGYLGEVEQALLDLDAWVANGDQPPPSTNYQIDALDQVQLAATAEDRHGVQPVVDLTAARAGTHKPSNQSIHVGVGRPVTLIMNAQVPPGTGKIVKVEWDFEGTGSFTATPLTEIGPQLNLHQTYTFTKPGVYFPVVRVTSQRNGDPTSPFGLIQNLASVRIVVQ
jgi:hypothetical protein